MPRCLGAAATLARFTSGMATGLMRRRLRCFASEESIPTAHTDGPGQGILRQDRDMCGTAWPIPSTITPSRTDRGVIPRYTRIPSGGWGTLDGYLVLWDNILLAHIQTSRISDISNITDISGTAARHRHVFYLRHHPVLGRPLARTGLRTVDPALQDKDKTTAKHGYSATRPQ